MTETSNRVDEFFDRYQTALLYRDAKALSELYSVPSLIVFPGTLIPVGDWQQTEDFFASSWDQYTGVEKLDRATKIMGEAPGSIWVEVTWSYHGRSQERFCYHLAEGEHGYQICVLTLMG